MQPDPVTLEAVAGPTEQERRDTEALRQACFAAADVLRDSARAKMLTPEQAAVELVKAYRAAERELSDSAPGAPRS